MKHVVFALYLLVVAALYLKPIFGEGALIAGDHPFYLALAVGVTDHLRTGSLLGGWSAEAFGGFPVFSSFLPSPLAFLAMAVVAVGTSIPVGLLYKGMVVLSVVFPAFALWLLLARRFHWVAAFGAANGYLLLTYSLAQPLQGMWVHYLGVGMVVLLIHLVDLWLTPEITVGRAVGLALLGVGGALTAAFTWPIWLALFALALAFYTWARRLTWRQVAMAAGPTACLAAGALALLAYAAAADSGWGSSPPTRGGTLADLLVRLPVWFLLPGESRALIEEVLPTLREGALARAATALLPLLGRHLPEFAIMALSVVGGSLFFARRRELEADPRHLLDYLSFALAFFVLCVVVPWHWLASRVPLLVPFRQDWFVVYVNLCLLVLAAYTLHEARRRWKRPTRFVLLLLVAAVFGLHLTRYLAHDASVAPATSHDSVIYQELAGPWAYIREHVDPRATRVMYEELDGVGFLDGGPTNLAALSPYETGVAAVVLQRPQTHVAFREPFVLARDNPLGAAGPLVDLMRRLNCQYLVLWHLGIKHRFFETGLFELVSESENRLFAVLRLKAYEPTWLDFDREVKALRGVEFSGKRFAFELDNPHPGNGAVFKMSYHPRWSARVNGEDRPVKPQDDLIRVDNLPTGRVKVEFTFRPLSPRLLS